MKSGWQTSEFWVTILTILFRVAGDRLGITMDDQAQLASTIAGGIASVLYIWSRTQIKTATPK